jgi:hypothetical protein
MVVVTKLKINVVNSSAYVGIAVSSYAGKS